MEKRTFGIGVFCIFLAWTVQSRGQEQVLDADWKHFRNTGPREWSDFPPEPPPGEYVLRFPGAPNESEVTLSIRQYDVKLSWRITLNGKDLGALVPDEKDLRSYYAIERGTLKSENTLIISCKDSQGDDIRLGEVALLQKPLAAVLAESHLAIEVRDADTGAHLPVRITITNDRGILQSMSGSARDPLALRPGHVYTGNGRAVLGLPAGTYNVYAGRGFEYGVDSAQVEVLSGDFKTLQLQISREVSTPGWASSDTHIHTYTWSGHGDASASERVLTIAGEGIELPISTDHNLAVDLRPFARDQNVLRYFTALTGNEVTTPVGHFNIFPVNPADEAIPSRVGHWSALAERLSSEGSRAIILNHARDVHVDFRPFDPRRHLSSAGMRLDDQPFFANAMEVINSGSQQTDQQELLRDWFGLLNHGLDITPTGSSDSHDVSRYLVGQSRTYIRCNDEDPGKINVDEAIRNFLEGNVMVSFGLMAEIEVNDAYGPGELVRVADEVKVSVKVSGPAWTRAEKISLYANGQKIREELINEGNTAGVKWQGVWHLTPSAQDLFLVAVAEGPDGKRPYWPIARPYQPTSAEWNPGILGISGAVWLDADHNGRRNSAKYYAEQLHRQSSGNLDELVGLLNNYDASVAIQAAALLFKQGIDLSGAEVTRALRRASPQARSGFQVVVRELAKRSE